MEVSSLRQMLDLQHALVRNPSGEGVLEVINPEQDKIVLNVGGIRHETLVSTLAKRPDTRLGELSRHHQELRADEYFFDRNPEVFNAVIDYYRSGELHIPMDVCGVVIKRELEYWNIKETLIHPCCWVHYCTNVDKVEALDSLNKIPRQEQIENEAMHRIKGVARARLAIWRLMCRPSSTKYAKVYSILSMLFVMAAITGCCLETVPHLQDGEFARKLGSSCLSNNTTNAAHDDTFQRLLPLPIFELRVLDYICNTFFSLELLIRLVVAPRPLTFIKSPITIIDVVAITPFYLMLLTDVIYTDQCTRGKRAFFIQIIFVLRVVRIFRVFQMLAYFKPLKILLRSLRDSVYELLILLVFIFICMLVFSTLAFYAERDYENSSFKTIPIGFWWALVTITTVGYGDMYPRTIAGYFVGSACALCGTVIMALTIPILSNNFTLYYMHVTTRAQADVKEKERETKILHEEEQLGFTKKSLIEDGSILVSKTTTTTTPTPPKAKPDTHPNEGGMTFRRTSTIDKNQQEPNQGKHILVGQGELGAFQNKSHEALEKESDLAPELKDSVTQVPTPEETNTV